MKQQPIEGQGMLSIEASRSHSDTPHFVRLLSRSDEPDSATSTWQSPQTHAIEIAATGIGFCLFLFTLNE
jgi:hypothetical protein